MKKALKIALFSVLGLLVVAGVLVWMEFGSLIKGAMSCEKLDEGMYYMEYDETRRLREYQRSGQLYHRLLVKRAFQDCRD